MRYTTIIDITEIPEVYRSTSARLVYLHLVCASGYHQEDQDQVSKSLRHLAWECGLSLSATRHALALLQRNNLLGRMEDGTLIVKKFVEPVIAKRQAGKVLVEGSNEANAKADEKQRLTRQLETLRRYYADFQQRGDEANMKAVLAEANKIKKKLNAM